MSEYHLVYTNLKSGVRLGELPVVSFSMEEAYNASGSLSADLLLEDTYTVEYATGLESYATFTDGYYRASPLPTGYAAAGVGVTLDVRFRINGASGGGATQEIITNGTSGGGGSGFIIRRTATVLRLVFNDGTWRTASSPSYTGGDTTVRVVADGATVTWYTSDNYGLSWDVWAAAAAFPYSPLSGGFWNYLDVGAGAGSSQFVGDIYWIDVYSDGSRILRWDPEDLDAWTLSGNEDVALTLQNATTTLTTPQGVSLNSLLPGATGIYMERNGVIMWGGVLWAMDMDVEGSTCSISAEGFMSYLDRVHINTDLTWAATDQGVIAKELLEAAMAKPGANIGLVAPTPTASTSRDRAYPALERKHFGEAIRQLADVEGGFSWRFEHSWNVDADGVDTSMVLDTSDAGRLTNYVFELGVNISLLSLSVDGTNVANYAEAWAQGEGDIGWYRFAYNSAALSTYPLLEVIEDFSDVKASDTLQGKADQALSRGAAPIKRAAIEVYSDSLPTLGSYEVGERITLKGSYGGIELAGLWRILEMKLDVSGNGEEKIELGLVPQGVFG